MQPGRILVIDDEEGVLITIQAVLEEDGHVVRIAQKTDEGLNLLRQGAFDLVLTDLRIDERDGMDMLRAVKTIDPELVVIMLTGYASLKSAIQALRAGAYDYLIKPCDVNELKLTIARGLEKRGLALALKARVAELEDANARIAGFADELQEKVRAATAQLAAQVEATEHANAELARLYAVEQQQTAHLQELNERKSSFLSMVAHELRTPLTGLRGFTDLLRMRFGTLDARQERIITLVSQQVERLSDLVNELLSLTNIEQRRLVLRPAPADLVRCVTDVIERFALVYPLREISFERQIECCPGSWDCDRLEQVLSNLLSNAIKYSSVGTSVTVTIALVPESATTDRFVRISVTDRGIGIPPEARAELFAKFFRASNAEAYQSGLGLGLFISNEIVQQHGGWIEFESKEGAGTTFSIILPVHDAELNETTAPSQRTVA